MNGFVISGVFQHKRAFLNSVLIEPTINTEKKKKNNLLILIKNLPAEPHTQGNFISKNLYIHN